MVLVLLLTLLPAGREKEERSAFLLWKVLRRWLSRRTGRGVVVGRNDSLLGLLAVRTVELEVVNGN